MFFCFVFGMLAAFGAACALWITLGAALNRGEVTAVCTERSAGRGRWLKRLGLVSRVVVIPSRQKNEQSEEEQ